MLSFNERVYEAFEKEQNVILYLLIYEKPNSATRLEKEIPDSFLEKLDRIKSSAYHHLNARERISEGLNTLANVHVLNKERQGMEKIYTANDLFTWSWDSWGGMMFPPYLEEEELHDDDYYLIMGENLLELFNDVREPYVLIQQFDKFDFETLILYFIYSMEILWELLACEHTLKTGRKVLEEEDINDERKNYVEGLLKDAEKKSDHYMMIAGVNSKKKLLQGIEEEVPQLMDTDFFESKKNYLTQFIKLMRNQLTRFVEKNRVSEIIRDDEDSN